MTSLKLFHSADLHLGLRFSSYPDEVSKKLSEVRFLTLERMVALANHEKCDLFAICGDLFDHLRVTQKDIHRTARILGQFEGCAVVLPGNHDYYSGQEDDIWHIFKNAGQDRIQVLTDKRPYSLKSFDIDATLYPAPCHNKHSKSHALGWMIGAQKESTRYHIGLAHGSYEGLTPDTEGEYYPMKKEDLLECGMDLWLMGHIHIQHPLRPGSLDRIFYPATPEPDGFDCKHEGKAWILEIDQEKQVKARSISTGFYRFQNLTTSIQSLQDLDLVKKHFDSSDTQKILLKLNLKGSLPREDYIQFTQSLVELKRHFFLLKTDYSAVNLELTPTEIDREFTRESFPYRLLVELAKAQEDNEALQIAYNLIKETRTEGRVLE